MPEMAKSAAGIARGAGRGRGAAAAVREQVPPPGQAESGFSRHKRLLGSALTAKPEDRRHGGTAARRHGGTEDCSRAC
jgi:hypothetical protein